MLFHDNNRKVCIKARRLTTASLPFIGQVTERTTVKRPGLLPIIFVFAPRLSLPSPLIFCINYCCERLLRICRPPRTFHNNGLCKMLETNRVNYGQLENRVPGIFSDTTMDCETLGSDIYYVFKIMKNLTYENFVSAAFKTTEIVIFHLRFDWLACIYISEPRAEPRGDTHIKMRGVLSVFGTFYGVQLKRSSTRKDICWTYDSIQRKIICE